MLSGKRTSTPHPSQQNLQNEIDVRDKQIEVLNDRVLTQDHELRQLRALKDSLAQLKKLEKDLDVKDNQIAELKKKTMIQEEAIGQWIEAMDEKKRQLLEKEAKNKHLQSELGVIEVRYKGTIEEQEGKIQRLERLTKEMHQIKFSLEQEIEKMKAEQLSRQSDSEQVFKDQLVEKDKMIADLTKSIDELKSTQAKEIKNLNQGFQTERDRMLRD